MATIAIPLKNDVAVPHYEQMIDAKYQLPMVELKNYPVPNVYADEEIYSQEAWGLTFSTRAAQNQIWKDVYALNPAVGNGELTTYSFTAPFTSKIKRIFRGRIKAAAYFKGKYNDNPYSFLTFAGMAGRIASRTGVRHNLLLYDSGTKYGAQKKAFMGTAGGNKFLIYAGGREIRTVPCNENGVPNGTGISTSLASNNLGDGCRSGSTIVFGAIANKFWVYYIAAEGASGGSYNRYTRVKARGSLYTLNTNGSITLVGHGAVHDSGQGSGGNIKNYYNIAGSYFHSNGHAYVLLYGYSYRDYSSKQLRIVTDVNCNVTSSFSESVIRKAEESVGISGNRAINVGWTGSKVLYTRGSTIYEVNAAVDQSTGESCAGHYVYPFAFSETTLKMSTASQNIVIPSSNDRLKIFGADVNGTVTNLGRESALFIYEVGTSKSQDSGFKGIYLKAKAVDQNGFSIYTQLLKLYLNEILTRTVEINSEDGIAAPNTIGKDLRINNDYQAFLDLRLSNQEVKDYRVKLRLKLEKGGSQQPAKIAFGATSGTYAGPKGNYEVSSLIVQL